MRQLGSFHNKESFSLPLFSAKAVLGPCADHQERPDLFRTNHSQTSTLHSSMTPARVLIPLQNLSAGVDTPPHSGKESFSSTPPPVFDCLPPTSATESGKDKLKELPTPVSAARKRGLVWARFESAFWAATPILLYLAGIGTLLAGFFQKGTPYLSIRQVGGGTGLVDFGIFRELSV